MPNKRHVFQVAYVPPLCIKNELYRKSLKHCILSISIVITLQSHLDVKNGIIIKKDLINQNKHNLGKTWSIICTVINNKRSIRKCSEFTHINWDITNDNEIALDQIWLKIH